MRLGRMAAKAVKWLARAAGIARANQSTIQGLLLTLINSNRLNRRLAKFFEHLQVIEETRGAHTEFWSRIDQAYLSGAETVTIDRNEIEYVHSYKRAFDRDLKPIGQKLVGQVADPDEDEDDYGVDDVNALLSAPPARPALGSGTGQQVPQGAQPRQTPAGMTHVPPTNPNLPRSNG